MGKKIIAEYCDIASAIYSSWQKNFCVENLPCSCMAMFVPYSFWVAVKMDIGFIEKGYLKKFGKIFAPSKMHMDFFKSRLGIDDRRLFYSGYPKCDIYYKNGDYLKEFWNGGGIKGENRILYMLPDW